MPTTRRALLTGTLSALAAALAGCGLAARPRAPLLPGDGPFAGGEYLGDLDLVDDSDRPVGETRGEGLDGRLRLDLATVGPDTLLTPPAAFYVRTLPPDVAPGPIPVSGAVATPLTLDPAALAKEAIDRGIVLAECAGNGQGEHFGLVSAGRWAGVSLADVLARAAPTREGTRVRVTGHDHPAKSPGGSKPGCAWILRWEDVDATGAFLATALDGAPLAPEHGAPVRLLVPGWYGCASVKWVKAIEVVADDVEATSQMREYASRTHQDGTPKLARDYRPPEIQRAAVPIRVERWRVGGEERLRIVGLVWGGGAPAGKLQIRFGDDAAWTPVTALTAPTDARTWALWWHDWGAPAGGTWTIRLRDPDDDGKRLRHGWYERAVKV